MSQARPHKSASVKDLEQTFKDYEFNKKVLSSMRAELLLRSTKSAKSLLDKVDSQLAEIARRDSFSRVQPKPSPKVQPQVSPPTAQPQIQKITQIPLIAPEPISKPLEVLRVEEVGSHGADLKATDAKQGLAAFPFIFGGGVFVVCVGLMFLSLVKGTGDVQNKIPKTPYVQAEQLKREAVKHSPIYTRPKESPVAAHESDDWLKYTDKGYTPEKPRGAQLPPPTIDDKRIQTYRDTVRNLLH